MVRTHYCEMIQPDAHHPKVIGYNVWAWIGHPLLGEIGGSHVIVKTKRQAQRTAREMREIYNKYNRKGEAMNKHTAGPWRVEKRLGSLIIRAKDVDVIAIALPDCEPSDANAQLIATAPELLEALKLITEIIDDPIRFVGCRSARYNRARAAIAKAEGGE